MTNQEFEQIMKKVDELGSMVEKATKQKRRLMFIAMFSVGYVVTDLIKLIYSIL